MTNYARRTPNPPNMSGDTPPESFIDATLATVQSASAISSASPSTSTRGQLSTALTAYGRFNDYFGTGKHLWPITAIADAKYLPPTYINHAEQDGIVVAVDSKDFMKKAKEILPEAELRLDMRDDERGHGFDITMKEDEEDWLKESLKWVEERWLA
jgi:hypothetical protein